MDFSPISQAKGPRRTRIRRLSAHLMSSSPLASTTRAFINSSPVEMENSIASSLSPTMRHVIDGFVLLDASNAELPEYAYRITVSPHGYNSVQYEDLRFFENLEYLDVSDNQLDVFDFAKLPKLKDLRMTYNHIHQITLNQNIDFNNCYVNLLSLDLSFNRISPEYISELKILPSLTELDLSHNELMTLPTNMFTLQTIERLTLDHNNLSDLDTFLHVSYMPCLRHLSLANNLLSKISAQSCGVHNFKLLSTLDLSCNYFSNEESLFPLTHVYRLEEIMLYGNPLLGPTGEDPLHLYIEDLEQQCIKAREGREDQPILVLIHPPKKFMYHQ